MVDQATEEAERIRRALVDDPAAAAIADALRSLAAVEGGPPLAFGDHEPPHFHAVYGEHKITVEIESEQVRGEFPPRALRLVLEWNGLHKQELLSNWQRARRRQPLRRVPPLE